MLQAGPVGATSHLPVHLAYVLINPPSQCPLAQRPDFNGTPRVWVLRVFDRGGRRVCL